MGSVDEDTKPLKRTITVRGEDGEPVLIRTIGEAAVYLTRTLGRTSGNTPWQATAVALESASRQGTDSLIEDATRYFEHLCQIENRIVKP